MKRPWAVSVSVHDPEVVAVKLIEGASGEEVTVVDLGDKRDGRMYAAWVSLFLGASEVLPFVVDLINGAEAASPGFLLLLLDELTG